MTSSFCQFTMMEILLKFPLPSFHHLNEHDIFVCICVLRACVRALCACLSFKNKCQLLTQFANVYVYFNNGDKFVNGFSCEYTGRHTMSNRRFGSFLCVCVCVRILIALQGSEIQFGYTNDDGEFLILAWATTQNLSKIENLPCFFFFFDEEDHEFCERGFYYVIFYLVFFFIVCVCVY